MDENEQILEECIDDEAVERSLPKKKSRRYEESEPMNAEDTRYRMENTELKARIRELENEVRADSKRNQSLSVKNDELEDKIEKLEEKLGDLKEASAKYLMCLFDGEL